MTTNHTPGRLRIKAAINGDVAVITEVDDIVAEFFSDIRYVGENARDMARANALLFVGASELLGVAQLILRGYGVTFHDAALRTLLADVVAKATGSTS